MKFKLNGFVVVMAVIAIVASSSALGVIKGSKHDMKLMEGNMVLSANAGEVPVDECRYCHAPHNGNTDAPLWDRANPVTTSFSPYSSNTMDTAAGQPTGVSKACLSCHDGATALDSVGTYTGNAANDMDALKLVSGGTIEGSTAILGNDLTNDHPVSIALIVGSEFQTANHITDTVGAGKRLTLYGTNNTVECGSCHDPHNSVNTNFLRNDGADLCTTCHIK